MRTALSHSPRRRNAIGLTLIEVMVAMGLGSIVMTMVASMTMYSSQAFYSMSNYVDLDVHSRNAVDIIGRELRQSTALVAFKTNSSSRFLTLTNTTAATSVTLNWSKDSGLLTLSKTGQPTQTLLTGCDNWNFAFYTRAPNVSSTNLSFNSASDTNSCKLINMSWKCSRTILGSKLNTETVQTAQVVLRNKVR